MASRPREEWRGYATINWRGGGLLVAGTIVAFQVGRQAAIAIGDPGPAIVESIPRPRFTASETPAMAQPVPAPEPQNPVPVRLARVGSARRSPGSTDEIRLLSRARDYDARGDYDQVLDLAVEHEQSHPAGHLAEEREALRVKALVGTGQANEARKVGEKFRRRFPRSVLLSKVDQMLASLDQGVGAPGADEMRALR